MLAELFFTKGGDWNYSARDVSLWVVRFATAKTLTIVVMVSEAVEADAFLRIYEAIEDSSRKVQVPVRHLCAIRKVVWSSFDYMTGPELGFTWEAVTSEFMSSGKSSRSNSSRDDSSLTSSVTKGCGSGADYEEIDDVYRQASELPYDVSKMNMLMCSDERLYLDEFMTESHSTIDGTTTVTASDSDHIKHVASMASTSRNEDLESSTNSDKDSSAHKAEEFIGMSSLDGIVDLLVLDETAAKNSEDLQGMVSSGVDSGIVGTVSMHSGLSTMASSHAKELLNVKQSDEVSEKSCIVNRDSTVTDNNYAVENCVRKEQSVQYVEQDDYETLCDLVGESSTVQLSDEEYVAKFVLAEQICSTPMPSNPVIHKLTLLPKRGLFVGSYLFQVNSGTRHDRAMCAISLLGDYSRWEWYAERQSIIEEAFIDIIPRLRISYLTENIEDFICRATKEISKLMSFIGVCEAYPLLSQNVHDIRFRQTYFGSEKLQDNSFLAKAITAVLLSQSHCVIVGDKKADVVKMLLTLCLFVAPEWRWLCIKPFHHPYSPYLRLQAIQRIELVTIMCAGVESHWPLTVIDLDRQIVCTSSPHPKHRILKLLKQKSDVTQILKETSVDYKDATTPKIELRNCHADPRVTNFLVRMDLLPFERNARLGFIRQFRLMIENSARALIAYVQDISEPDSSYKQHTTSARWSLWPARKSLDLVSNASFLVTLAEAERILPDIADFICESNKL
uniref:UDENN FLCN/SMCR8-type domain-containing protein n=1 Tax=Elaeophora elaphi TaxID=1147741 RepID=A0A0R3RFR2_9BILA